MKKGVIKKLLLANKLIILSQKLSLKSKKFPPSLKSGGWKDFIEGSTKQDLSAISQTYELKKCLDNSEYTWKTLLFHQHPDAYIEKKKK